jgi:hypothetical protein
MAIDLVSNRRLINDQCSNGRCHRSLSATGGAPTAHTYIMLLSSFKLVILGIFMTVVMTLSSLSEANFRKPEDGSHLQSLSLIYTSYKDMEKLGR